MMKNFFTKFPAIHDMLHCDTHLSKFLQLLTRIIYKFNNFWTFHSAWEIGELLSRLLNFPHSRVIQVTFDEVSIDVVHCFE